MRNLTKSSVTFLLILLPFVSRSQQAMEILLSNHTFTSGRPEVGTIHISPGSDASYRLKGKDARIFRIEGNRLFVKQELVGSAPGVLNIDIEGRNARGKYSGSFRILRDQFHRNGVIAHRGAWKNTGAAENSILALDHAVKLGCEGSEFDVHMSADSVIVVNHDPTIQGLTIANASAKELTALKLTSGENLPTLEAYLKKGIQQTGTKLVLEIKRTTDPDRARRLAAKAVNLVKDLKAQAWIDYISFDYVICQEIQRLDPFARIAYLNGDKSPAELAADRMWGFDYHFDVLTKNESWIAEARTKGLTTNTWTVNDEKAMKWFLDKQINFITTNEPELLLTLVEKR